MTTTQITAAADARLTEYAHRPAELRAFAQAELRETDRGRRTEAEKFRRQVANAILRRLNS